MKKYFILAAAALVALTACTKMDVTNDTPARRVSFNVGTFKAQTKADPGTKHALQGETESFSSLAWLHANGATDGTAFFGAGETITYDSTVPEWAPSTEYFWPKSADSYINFVSWFATNSKNPTTKTETALSWGTAAAPVTIAKDDNILFADEAWRFSSNNNPATYTTTSGVAEGVPTLFHHALAKIQFNMKLKTTTKSTKTIWDVAVQTATLKIGNNGYLDLVNADPTTASTTVAWKVGTTPATSEIVGWARPTTPTLETIVETSSTASDVTKDFAKLTFENFAPKTLTDGKYESASQEFLAERTVLPQTLGTTVKLAMTFKISIFHDADEDGTKDGAAYSEEVVTISETDLKDLVSTITAWNMNTKVVYNVTIDPVGKKVLFDPAVVDWATNTSVDTQIYPQP